MDYTIDETKHKPKPCPLFECGDSVCDIKSRMRWKVVRVIDGNGSSEDTYECVDDLHGIMRFIFPQSKLYPYNPVGYAPDLEYLLNLLKTPLIDSYTKLRESRKDTPEYDVKRVYDCLQDYDQIKRIYDRLYLCYTRQTPLHPKPSWENVEPSGVIVRNANYEIYCR